MNEVDMTTPYDPLVPGSHMPKGKADQILCRMNVHYWNWPGGWCTSCGAPDVLPPAKPPRADGMTRAQYVRRLLEFYGLGRKRQKPTVQMRLGFEDRLGEELRRAERRLSGK